MHVECFGCQFCCHCRCSTCCWFSVLECVYTFVYILILLLFLCVLFGEKKNSERETSQAHSFTKISAIIGSSCLNAENSVPQHQQFQVIANGQIEQAMAKRSNHNYKYTHTQTLMHVTLLFHSLTIMAGLEVLNVLLYCR